MCRATREIVQHHKDLLAKKKAQERELEELIALREALVRETGFEGVVSSAKDARGDELLDDLSIEELMAKQDRETVDKLKRDLAAMRNNRYAVDIMAHIDAFGEDY